MLRSSMADVVTAINRRPNPRGSLDDSLDIRLSSSVYPVVVAVV